MEQAPVALDLRRHEADEVADAVPLQAGELAGGIRFVVDVRLDDLDTGRNGFGTGTAVQQGELPLTFGGHAGRDGGTDGAGAADEQGFLSHARASL